MCPQMLDFCIHSTISGWRTSRHHAWYYPLPPPPSPPPLPPPLSHPLPYPHPFLHPFPLSLLLSIHLLCSYVLLQLSKGQHEHSDDSWGNGCYIQGRTVTPSYSPYSYSFIFSSINFYCGYISLATRSVGRLSHTIMSHHAISWHLSHFNWFYCGFFTHFRSFDSSKRARTVSTVLTRTLSWTNAAELFKWLKYYLTI